VLRSDLRGQLATAPRSRWTAGPPQHSPGLLHPAWAPGACPPPAALCLAYPKSGDAGGDTPRAGARVCGEGASAAGVLVHRGEWLTPQCTG